MKLLGLNLLFTIIFFITNSIIGKFQSGHKLFQYGRFSFNLDEGDSFVDNFVLKIINPTVYMAILCAVFQYLGCIDIFNSLWMIIPIYWLLRIIYMFVKNILIYTNIKYEFLAFLMSALLGEGAFWLVLKPLMDKQESVFISREELRDAVWYAIIAYSLKIIWDVYKTYLNADNIYPLNLRVRAVEKKLNRFSDKYGQSIENALNEKNFAGKSRNEVISLIYAIMIYEDYNRPFAFRIVEYIVKFICFKKEMTLGVMQVKTKKLISSKTSVRLGVEKIINAYLMPHDDKISNTIWDYNYYCEHYSEVRAIYEMVYDQIMEERTQDKHRENTGDGSLIEN